MLDDKKKIKKERKRFQLF